MRTFGATTSNNDKITGTETDRFRRRRKTDVFLCISGEKVG